MFLSRLIFTSLIATISISCFSQDVDAVSQASQWAISTGSGNTRSFTGKAVENYISLRRYTEMGSIAIERLQLQRFGTTDTAFAIDAYPKLWTGAYANVRYQSASTASLYPQQSWRAEIYQNAGSGWELSASHDHLGFSSDVNIDGIAVGHYWGNFYARLRHQRVNSSDSTGSGDRFMLRYYYEGDADHYIEINASKGKSDDFSSAQIAGSRSDSKGLAWYHYVNQNWGLKLSGSQSNDSTAYGKKERNFTAGLSYRW
jgi:YaiO family outer membrane protein